MGWTIDDWRLTIDWLGFYEVRRSTSRSPVFVCVLYIGCSVRLDEIEAVTVQFVDSQYEHWTMNNNNKSTVRSTASWVLALASDKIAKYGTEFWIFIVLKYIPLQYVNIRCISSRTSIVCHCIDIFIIIFSHTSENGIGWIVAIVVAKRWIKLNQASINQSLNNKESFNTSLFNSQEFSCFFV